MGDSTRRSVTTKATNDAAETSSRPMVEGDPQPHSGENVSGTSRHTRNTPSSTDPAASTRGACSRRSLRGSMNQPQSSTTIPMGMLMRKIQRQPTASTMKPPRGGPTVRPM